MLYSVTRTGTLDESRMINRHGEERRALFMVPVPESTYSSSEDVKDML